MRGRGGLAPRPIPNIDQACYPRPYEINSGWHEPQNMLQIPGSGVIHRGPPSPGGPLPPTPVPPRHTASDSRLHNGSCDWTAGRVQAHTVQAKALKRGIDLQGLGDGFRAAVPDPVHCTRGWGTATGHAVVRVARRGGRGCS